jgi:uncharacterized protein
MKKKMAHLSIILISSLLLFVFGCGLLGGGTREMTRFFVLKPIPGATMAAPASSNGPDALSIGIGPVKLPDSLNRQQMVTRISENEVRVESFCRWAAPLTENITSVLAENLSSLLNTNRVVTFPWAVAKQPAYQVRITVVDFMGALGGEATLEVRWVLSQGENQQELENRHSSFKAPVPSSGHSALVTAESRLLAELSREIAQALQSRERN